MLKIEKDLMKEEHPPVIRIANHLIEVSKIDGLVKETLDKENKSLKEMYSYVTSEAKKKAVNGSAMIEDAEVYGWAQHYYADDSIINSKTKKEMSTSVQSTKDIELPEEEIDVFEIDYE